jgi:integrase
MFRRMTRERYLTDDELARFMRVVRERRHIHQPRDHALFALLANTGMRPAEVRALTRGDCHLEGPEPWVRVMRLKKKKHIPEFDDLPLSQSLAAVLQQHLDTSTDDPIFPIAPKPMRQLFHYYRNEAGLDPARLYALRHTAATRLYASTRNLGLVQSMLGHEKPDMTAIYIHVPHRVLSELATSFPVTI